MARAMRPVVILMLLATVLFVVDGVLDHNYANQPIFEEYKGVGWTSFVFAVANLLMALAVARGSERTLLGRVALSAFFIVERPLTAFILGPKPIEAVVVHFATAIVELIILVGAVRVWRLGHSILPADMDAMFALDSAGPGAPAAAWNAPTAAPAEAEPAEAEPAEAEPTAITVGVRTDGWALLLGVLTLLLAAMFVADGAVAGFIPGGRDWGLSADSSGWLVYLFAVVILSVAAPAVHGGTIALRLLFALGLIFFVERAFSPFALKVVDPVQLGLHGLGAFISLALAVATAGAIRAAGGRLVSSHNASPAT